MNTKDIKGPGLYDPKISSIKEKKPSWSFGKKYKFKNKENFPGPG